MTDAHRSATDAHRSAMDAVGVYVTTPREHLAHDLLERVSSLDKQAAATIPDGDLLEYRLTLLNSHELGRVALRRALEADHPGLEIRAETRSHHSQGRACYARAGEPTRLGQDGPAVQHLALTWIERIAVRCEVQAVRVLGLAEEAGHEAQRLRRAALVDEAAADEPGLAPAPAEAWLVRAARLRAQAEAQDQVAQGHEVEADLLCGTRARWLARWEAAGRLGT